MSNNNNNTSSSGGIGFLGLLTIVFITLKLLNVITWSWFWVLSPIIFAFALAIFIAVILFFTIFGKPLIRTIGRSLRGSRIAKNISNRKGEK
jgi:ABC-type sugar transport system permease subunit